MTPLDVERNVRKNVKTPKDTKRNKLYHPNLEYIVEKIIHSPYLTKPGDKYPETTFSVPEAIRDFKEQGIIYKNIPENEVPFDFEQSKKRFVEEIVNYKPKYSAKVFLNEEPSVRNKIILNKLKFWTPKMSCMWFIIVIVLKTKAFRVYCTSKISNDIHVHKQTFCYMKDYLSSDY